MKKSIFVQKHTKHNLFTGRITTVLFVKFFSLSFNIPYKWERAIKEEQPEPVFPVDEQCEYLGII